MLKGVVWSLEDAAEEVLGNDYGPRVGSHGVRKRGHGIRRAIAFGDRRRRRSGLRGRIDAFSRWVYTAFPAAIGSHA
eukprot:716940-Prorocentrum_minimum.AAC.1